MVSVKQIDKDKYQIGWRAADGAWKRKVIRGSLRKAKATVKDMVKKAQNERAMQGTYLVFAQGIANAFRIAAVTPQQAKESVEAYGHNVVVVTTLYGDQNLVVSRREENLLLSRAEEEYRDYWVTAAGREVRGSREKTWAKDSASLRRGITILAELGCLTVRDVTRTHIAKLQDKLAKSGLSAATVNKVKRVCSPLWSWAAGRGMANENPWGAWKTHRAMRSAPQHLTQGQIMAVLADAKGTDVYPVLATAALAGLRNSELVRLRVGHLTADGIIVESVSGDPTKSREARLVPWVFDDLREILSDAFGRNRGEFVFERYRSDNAMCAMVRRFCKRHSKHQFTLQTLRRSFVTILIKEFNKPVALVSQWAGHKDVKTTQGYYLGKVDWKGEPIRLSGKNSSSQDRRKRKVV